MLQNKTFNIILSVLIAIVLWVYVITEENPTVTQKFENVPVQLLNEESLASRGLIVLDADEPTVTVTVEGKRVDVSSITAGDFVITADVYGYGVGENHIPVNVDAPAGVTVTEVKSSRVTVNIDDLISVSHEIDVAPASELEDGKEIHVIEVSPEQVMVTGARSIVTQVEKVEARINSGKLSEKAKNVSGSLTALDSNGQEIADVSLSSGTADVQAQLLSTKDVPLEVGIVGEVSSRYTVSDIKMPETVTIMGAKEALEGIDLVKAEDVDISGITSTSKIGLSIKLPEDVYLSQKSQEVSVYVVINNVAVSEVSVPAANVQLLGIAEGCTAYIDENVGSIKLTVRGAESLVQSAAASDFVISTDLTGMEQGTHEVTLNLEYIKGFSSVEMEPVRVHVTIKNEAQ